MVHLVAARNIRSKLFFNIDTPVGLGARGSARDDVLLVQFYFVLKQGAADKETEIYKSIRQTGVCDENLIEAIRTYQGTVPEKLVQDGLVSRAQGTHFDGGVWTIVGMNFGICVYCLPMWPRIDMHPKCDRELGRAIRDAVGASHSS
jgi:hypothetical protein